MKIKIEDICCGKYNLRDSLFFDMKSFNYIRDEYEPKPAHIELEIDKKSALEIMHTLLDSMCMLDNNMEELICEIDEKIEMERKRLL